MQPFSWEAKAKQRDATHVRVEWQIYRHHGAVEACVSRHTWKR